MSLGIGINNSTINWHFRSGSKTLENYLQHKTKFKPSCKLKIKLGIFSTIHPLTSY